MNVVSATVRFRRRFTEDEDRILREDFHAHVPTLEIARKLGRDEGTLRQRIFRLGLRRSPVVTRALGWAPEHLKSQLPDMGAEQFVAACYVWRDEQATLAAQQTADSAAEMQAAIERACAEIDARHDIPRDHKMIAKRIAGMTLEAIAAQHGVTRERVRQITSPEHVAAVRLSGPPSGLTGIAAQIEKLEAKRDLLVSGQVGRLLSAWNASPQTVQDKFLESVGASLKTAEGIKS